LGFGKMVAKSTYEILQEVLHQEESKKQNEGSLIKFAMQYEQDNTTIFQFEIKSKSRPGLIHHTYIVVRDDYYVSWGCDCEGYRFHKKCWHLNYANEFIKTHNLW
jgi:hypothetical protein